MNRGRGTIEFINSIAILGNYFYPIGFISNEMNAIFPIVLNMSKSYKERANESRLRSKERFVTTDRSDSNLFYPWKLLGVFGSRFKNAGNANGFASVLSACSRSHGVTLRNKNFKEL
ncbi:hypothetical protein CH370_18330 [Leptospira kmetyi]|uniref:Uncharacterized protein n=1 Tax=Leptospira kmetyi TaxID=408139 RepID=A0AAD0XPF4_9LEPT|nr:hypothetical protein EFP84_05745 [Leptospira kmetyi]PJZ27621.1 hypothetical protein CH378_22120 [Leptospira kmetyi]PJZ40117.1 hypothetical protein CH370_18330 [Leptospira kmetyi]